MRVKIIRWTDPTSSSVNLRVLRWCDAQWEPVKDFGLHESEQANEFAMKLSMSKRVPVELAVFEDGEKLAPNISVPPIVNPTPENIIDQLLRQNDAANAALPDYEDSKP
jgi:hypothetical protein